MRQDDARGFALILYGRLLQHVHRRGPALAALIAAMVVLYAAAGVGMSYVAGFGAVHRRLLDADWWWLVATCGGVAIAYLGYFFAYRGVNRARDGPTLDRASLIAVVTAGFGGFLIQGGGALDRYAMRSGGDDPREARVRVEALAGFEHAALALVACPVAVIALVVGAVPPRSDFTWCWATIPPIGFGVGIWAAERWRDRLRDCRGWRGQAGVLFDGIDIIWAILSRPRRYGYAVLGMMLYWSGDAFALWAATAAFGLRLSVFNVTIALATGMILTRRTAPLGGAGIVLVVLVATLWYASATPFAPAVLGVAGYRLFSLFGPVPFGLAALPRIRALGQTGKGTAGGGTSTTEGGEPALQH